MKVRAIIAVITVLVCMPSGFTVLMFMLMEGFHRG